MLKLEYLFENYELAKEALTNWEHDSDTLDQMLAGFRISSNAVYPFCQNGAVCFLRLAPVTEKREGNVLGEMEFIQYLVESGYPACRPIPTKKGEVCLRLDTRWGPFYATVFYKVDGVPIEDTGMSGAVMSAYGKALGKLHRLSAAYNPKTKKWTHDEVLAWIASVLSEYNAPDHVVAELFSLKDELDKLPRTQDNYGLVHYDFEPDNVFYDRKKGICSVIDFDDGMYHWFALDIAQVLDALEDSLCGHALQAAVDSFLQGYQEEYGPVQQMQRARPLMQRFIRLYGYARLIRCVAKKGTHEPAWMEELRKKLNQAILEKEAAMPHP